MRAAVLRQKGDDSLDVVEDAAVVDTGPGLVRVAIRATGVCHSDLSAMNGTIPLPVPAVLGHEGAGEVVEIGDGVPALSVGDHVIVVWVPPCGTCSLCLGGQPNLCRTVTAEGRRHPRFQIAGEGAFGFLETGTFAEEVVLPYQSVVRIEPDVPWDIASLLGCGVMTGLGAAINSAPVTPGASVVVFGCGGVGISVIQGARLAGATEIVAVDLIEAKREQAKRFGATHECAPGDLEALKSELTDGLGFDYAFEAIGTPSTIRATYDAARRGGTACIVGVGSQEEPVEFNAFELSYMARTLVGSVYGSADVRRDFHRLLRLWRAGKLDLAGMISQRIGLEDINRAFEDMQAGRVIRTVVEF